MRPAAVRVLPFVLLLSVLVPACHRTIDEPEPTDPVRRESFHLLQKVKQVTGKKHPETRQNVANDLEQAIKAGVDAEYAIGPELTDTGKAYKLYWVDQTFIAEEFSAADAPWNNIAANSVAYRRRNLGVPAKPDVPQFTQRETFARGLPYFLSDASAGEPEGTVLYGHDIPVRLRVRRQAKPVAAALSLQVVTESGSSLLLVYPELDKAPADQQLSQTYTWSRGLGPGNTVHGVLAMVDPQSVGNLAPGDQPQWLSNPVIVTFRVAVKPQK